MSGFFERVYELVRQIPKGKVVTYGQIAKKLGTKDSRKVGWGALHSKAKLTRMFINLSGRFTQVQSLDIPSSFLSKSGIG